MVKHQRHEVWSLSPVRVCFPACDVLPLLARSHTHTDTPISGSCRRFLLSLVSFFNTHTPGPPSLESFATERRYAVGNAGGVLQKGCIAVPNTRRPLSSSLLLRFFSWLVGMIQTMRSSSRWWRRESRRRSRTGKGVRGGSAERRRAVAYCPVPGCKHSLRGENA
jgi:hypothetical protein